MLYTPAPQRYTGVHDRWNKLSTDPAEQGTTYYDRPTTTDLRRPTIYYDLHDDLRRPSTAYHRPTTIRPARRAVRPGLRTGGRTRGGGRHRADGPRGQQGRAGHCRGTVLKLILILVLVLVLSGLGLGLGLGSGRGFCVLRSTILHNTTPHT